MENEEAWAELGRQVRARRNQMGLLQNSLSVSDSTIRRLENGTLHALRPSTVARIERALRWEEGTAGRILNGQPAPPVGTPYDHSEASQTVLGSREVAIATMAAEILVQLAEMPDRTAAEERFVCAGAAVVSERLDLMMRVTG